MLLPKPSICYILYVNAVFQAINNMKLLTLYRPDPYKKHICSNIRKQVSLSQLCL